MIRSLPLAVLTRIWVICAYDLPFSFFHRRRHQLHCLACIGIANSLRLIPWKCNNYQVAHIAKNTPGGLTPDRLSSGCHANYHGVIVTLGAVDNAWSGILTTTDLTLVLQCVLLLAKREQALV